jgi:hypothetical protein
MSWPFSPKECPQCRFLHPIDPPMLDDAGYEIHGFCLHPRIAMDLFILKERDPDQLGTCPCFSKRREDRREAV